MLSRMLATAASLILAPVVMRVALQVHGCPRQWQLSRSDWMALAHVALSLDGGGGVTAVALP
jgi:hypothetical protein